MADEQKYITLLTQKGFMYETECLTTNSEFHITHIALGDGLGRETIPNENQTSLINEVKRYPITGEQVSVKDGLYYAILKVPEVDGGFTIREIGGYNSAGDLVLVANFPPTVKHIQVPDDLHKIYVRMDLCKINLKTFPSVVDPNLSMPSMEYLTNKLEDKAAIDLSNLNETGEQHFDLKYTKTDFSNLSSTGEQHFDTRYSKTDLSNLAAEGEEKIINTANEHLPIMSASQLGIGKPDGETLIVDNGTLSVPIDGDTIVTKDGALSVGKTSSGFKMFDIVLKDHVLSYEESEGLTAFGDYAYKSASAGNYYGNPDFYNKVIEEYQQATSTEKLLTKQNFKRGDAILNKKNSGKNITLSDFPTDTSTPIIKVDGEGLSSYIFLSELSTYKLHATITLGTNIDTEQAIFAQGNYSIIIGIKSKHILLALSSNGTSWNLSNSKLGTYTLTAGAIYEITFEKTATEYSSKIYSNGKQIDSIVITNSTQINAGGQLCLGSHFVDTKPKEFPFKGLIHLVKNGEFSTYIENYWYPYNTITVKKHSNGHRFYDLNNSTTVQGVEDLYNRTGMAYLYGVDTTNERIRIPRNDKYFMSGKSSDVGNMLEAGLPNITGEIEGLSSFSRQPSGAFRKLDSVKGASGDGSDDRVIFDASHCSDIYGHSTTVQTDAVKLIPYMVTGTAVSDTSWVDVVTEVEGGVKDLEDAADAEIARIKSEGLDGYAKTTWVESFVQTFLKNNGGFATFSKGYNGYYKFTNGLIIQWGGFAYQGSKEIVITLPTAFTSTNYKVVTIDVGSAVLACAALPATTSTFKAWCSKYTTDIHNNYIAIGY